MDPETLDFLRDLETGEVNRPANDSIIPSGQRECPICKQKMHVEVEYGVHLDVCENHGLWLDRGELPAIMSSLRAGNRIDRAQAIRRARRDGKLSGTLFGIWSLMFD